MWSISSAMPDSSMASAILSGSIFPAAKAVRTDRPSVSMTRMRLGTLLLSTSPSTEKYVSEKLDVSMNGASGPGSPTL